MIANVIGYEVYKSGRRTLRCTTKAKAILYADRNGGAVYAVMANGTITCVRPIQRR